MSDPEFPAEIDIRVWAAQGRSARGRLWASALPRISSAVLDRDFSVTAAIQCKRDEQKRDIVLVSIETSLTLLCQRCLGPVDLRIVEQSALAVFSDYDDAKTLPSDIDPLITDGKINLWKVVEEEVLLALPSAAVHDDQDCFEHTQSFTGAIPEEEAPSRNPFSILMSLTSKG